MKIKPDMCDIMTCYKLTWTRHLHRVSVPSAPLALRYACFLRFRLCRHQIISPTTSIMYEPAILSVIVKVLVIMEPSPCWSSFGR